jgi:hypothetical protein
MTMARFHLVRAVFWILMVPVTIYMGWQTSVFLIFLYSTYANFIGDIDAYVAEKAKKQNDG